MENHEIVDSYQEIYDRVERLMEEGIEGETIPPYMTAPPEWYDNETEFIIEARGAGRKNDGMD